MYLKCKYCGKEIDCDEYDFPREYHDCKEETMPDSSSAIPKKEEKYEMDNYQNLNDMAHELWAIAQLSNGEGIEDAVERIINRLNQVKDIVSKVN